MDALDNAAAAPLHADRRWRRLDAHPEQVFQRLARIAATSVSAEGAFVAFCPDSRPRVLTSSGLTLRSGHTAPWADTILARAIAAGEPVVIENAEADVAIQRERLGTGALLVLPLALEGRSMEAVLCVVDGRPRPWRPDQIALLQDAATGVLRELELLDAMREAERESAERSAILESAGVGICGVDGHGRITFANRHAAVILGAAPHELRGQPIRRILADAGAELGADDGARCPLDGLGGTAEARHTRLGHVRRRDGSSVPVEFASYPVHEDGAVSGAVVTFADISERRAAEAEFSASEERYRRLVELLPDGIIVVTGSRIAFANPSAVRIAGARSVDDLVGMRITDLVPPQQRPAVRASLAQLYRSGEPTDLARPLEGTLLRLDGRVLSVGAAAVPLMFRGRRGAQVVLRDLTEQQQAADALKRSEQQLYLSQKVEAVGRLAGGIAHDFNNMLTAISGFATLLDPLPDEETARVYVDEIRKATDRAAALTRQLLAFSRRQVLKPVSLDVNAAIRDMSKLFRRVIGEHIELDVRLDPGAGCALADPSQFEQVLMNLVVNSRDAMEHGGTLIIETGGTWLDESYSGGQFRLVPGPYVLIAVADTGCGMDAETLERVFEPFFTTKPPSRGTGLGLSTVYGIVKQSNGYVWGYSEPGQGTTFKVYLPQVSAPAAAVPEPPKPALRVVGSETILLVEDEPAVRLLTRTLLEQCGYRVLEAADGEAALALAARHEDGIDLLLTDVVMPKMGGRELAQRLCELRPGLRVIYVSGYAEHAITRHGVLEEGRVLLQKPYAPDALVSSVRAALQAD